MEWLESELELKKALGNALPMSNITTERERKNILKRDMTFQSHQWHFEVGSNFLEWYQTFRIDAAASMAAAGSLATTTPFPAARPSAFTTHPFQCRLLQKQNSLLHYFSLCHYLDNDYINGFFLEEETLVLLSGAEISHLSLNILDVFSPKH